MKCKHCGEPIRWVESMGWVHGRLGEGYEVLCPGGGSVATMRREIYDDIVDGAE